MKKYFKLYTLMTALLMVCLSSCQKDEVDPGGTAVETVSGEWWVQVQVINATTKAVVSPYSTSYYSLSTYNTANNDAGIMWMDDSESYYGLKAKVNVNVDAKTFSVTSADENYFGVKVTITNGVIGIGTVKAPGSGATTDAISYDAAFSDDPAHIYQFKGYRRTRFSQDDH